MGRKTSLVLIILGMFMLTASPAWTEDRAMKSRLMRPLPPGSYRGCMGCLSFIREKSWRSAIMRDRTRIGGDPSVFVCLIRIASMICDQ